MEKCDYYKMNLAFQQSKEIHGRQVTGSTDKIFYCSHPAANELSLSSISKVVPSGPKLTCDGNLAKCQLAEKP